MRFNNQQVKLPKAKSHVRDLSCSTITSMSFYQNSPVYIQEVIKGDKVKLQVENFCRLNTMRSPTFGRVTIRNRVFFVPLRTVWSRWDEFITQQFKFTPNNSITNVPVLYESNIIYCFGSSSNGYSEAGSSTDYDFTYLGEGSSTTVYYRKFTRKGRFLYRILVNLGYNINFGLRISTGAVITTGSRTFSALPLMAYYRIWCDFFQYKMSTNYREYDVDYLNANAQRLHYGGLVSICDTICSLASLYDDDYFTLAGESPNIPIYGNESTANTLAFNMSMPTTTLDGNEGNDVVGTDNATNDAPNQLGTPQEPQLHMQSSSFGASALNFLQRAADYFRRKFAGGSTVVQQYFNEYGIELKAEEITHAKHLGSFETPVNIMDITGTSENNFGAQTSLGRGAGQNTFSWTADEFGYIIVTSVVVAHSCYNHGTPRLATRIKPFEFYHPDFDGLGMEAIRIDEVSSGSQTVPSQYYDPNKTFGFIPTYGSYKTGHDTLSGDFIIRSSQEAYKGYYLSRLYKPEDFEQNPPHAGETFRNPNALQNGWNPSHYDNIFLSPSIDNFLLFFNFNVQVVNDIRPLLDSYDWYADGDTLNMQGGGNNFGDN